MKGRVLTGLATALVVTVLAAACGGSTPTPTPTRPAATPTAGATTPTVTLGDSSPTASATTPAVTPADASPTSIAAPGATPSPAATSGAAGQPAVGALVFRLVPEQSEARYRAREQLLGRSLPNDAVGRTNAVAGQIVFATDGSIDSAQSRFTVDLATLQSDEARRDNYIKQNTLQVDRYPTAEFQPTAARGLPWPLPASGSFQFQLEGNLTVHGVTKPVTWDVRATVENGRITGTATTQVTFEDFGMTPPRVPIVLSLEDTITLELDFTFEPVS